VKYGEKGENLGLFENFSLVPEPNWPPRLQKITVGAKVSGYHASAVPEHPRKVVEVRH
jgi:hypothetical protein